MASFVDRILSHGPKKKVLTQEQAARSIVVSNIAPQTADENIVIHFQKQKNGGGEIDHVHIPKKGTAVITFESSEVAKRALGYSHILEESKLKLHLFVPEEPREVFKEVKARVNFGMFELSPHLSRGMLEDLKKNTKVAEVDSKGSKDSKAFIVSGTFSQIKAAHKYLQILINQNGKKRKEVIYCGGNGEQTQQDSSHCSDKVTSDTSTIGEFNSFEVQPQFMKLLKRVYKTQLKEIEENFCVQIVWDEKTTQVRISSRKNRQNRFQEGCDAFIDLYQKFYPNIERKEVEFPDGTDEARINKAVSLAETEDPVIIEMVDKNLVVYAEKNTIRTSVQSLKERLGLTNDGSSRKTKRGQRSKRRDAREENQTSQQGRCSFAQGLSENLDNGVKLSLYQGDITDEQVDAIVNAANEWLQHGAGVAAAIVHKGGRQIQDESNWITNQYGRLDVGGTTHTSGGNLPCRYVIHTVGPRWKEHGREKSISLLHRACVESLRLAAQLELSSIALTAISSGIFGMPKDICARVMFKAVEQFSSSNNAEFSTLRDVRIVIIDDSTISVFQEEFVKRYLSHEASSETVTTQTRPSDDHRATPPNPDSKRDVGKSKGYDLVDQTQSGDTTPPDGQQEQNNNVDSSGIAPFTDEENSGQRAVPDSFSNQDAEKKESLPTSIESPQMEGNEVSHELKQTYAASVVNAVKGDESADFKAFSRMGRGRGKFAPTFQISSATSAGKGKSAPLNGSTIADSGTGRGMICNSPSPPGLAVSEEGKNLAKSLGDRVIGVPKSNVDGFIIDKNDVDKNEPSSDSLKDANNSNNDGKNPGEDSLNGRPTDHCRCENNLTPEEKMLDKDKTTRKSERPSSDGCRKRPPVENTENDKPSHDQRKKDHTKSGKEVKEESEPVAHATNEETMSSQNPLPLKTTEGEVQTAIKNSAQNDSSTSCPHSSSDQRKKDHTKSGKKVKEESEPVSHATEKTMSSQNPLTLTTTEGEVQTAIKNSAQDDSSTSCSHSSSDHPVSHQSGNKVDKDNTRERRNVEDRTSQDSDSSPPPLSDMQFGHRKNEPNCLMCMNFNKDPLYPSKCGLDHFYCKSCTKHLKKTGLCPQCDKEGLLQPTGNMTWITKKESLPGYEDCEVIAMFFTFYEGIQGPGHPNPGQPYSALHTSAFLPCNSDGKEVCSLLKRAFDSRLLFTIGTSPTTGEKNKIIWNGIELKTNQSGGPASYGYPDPSYLDRVKKQLAEKGITQLHG